MFLTTGAVNKDIKSKRKFWKQSFCNSLGLFDVLPNFLFATSAFISNKHGIYELSHELPNGLRLGILQQCDKWVKNKKVR